MKRPSLCHFLWQFSSVHIDLNKIEHTEMHTKESGDWRRLSNIDKAELLLKCIYLTLNVKEHECQDSKG